MTRPGGEVVEFLTEAEVKEISEKVWNEILLEVEARIIVRSEPLQLVLKSALPSIMLCIMSRYNDIMR